MNKKGLVKVTVIGDLGADPEIKLMKSGLLRAQVSVAENETWETKEGSQHHVEWHRVVFMGRLAEVVQQYLKAGSRIYVEGKLRTRKWSDSNGVERYTTEIHALELRMLDKVATQKPKVTEIEKRSNSVKSKRFETSYKALQSQQPVTYAIA